MDNPSDRKKQKFHGVFIQFDGAVDFDFAETIRRAVSLYVGVEKSSLVLMGEGISIQPPGKPKTDKS